MPRINFIHFCDNAFITAGSGNLNVIGIFDIISSKQFPFTYPRFNVVVNLEASAGKHGLEFVFKHEGKNILAVKGELVSDKPTLQFIQDIIGLVFHEEGIYSVEVLIDGQLVGKKSLTVNKV